MLKSAYIIMVGQKVHYTGDRANASGNGAVVAIKSNPAPFDSSKTYEVVLEDGRRIGGLHRGNFSDTNERDFRFWLSDEFVDITTVGSLLANCWAKEARDRTDKAAKAAEFEKAKADAYLAGKALGLLSEAEFGKSGKRGSAAAWNLRQELKAAGIKASVKQDSHYAIDVTLTNDADKEKAKAIMRKYVAGSFDGMTDCYEYHPGAWGEVFGDVRYVSGRSVEGYCF